MLSCQFCGQVCLAAETCKHVSFDVRHDAWWSSQGFQCGSHPPQELHYWNIVVKVNALLAAQP